MKVWNVYLHGKKIDTVFFSISMSQTEVLLALINHDGYDPSILVKESKSILDKIFG